MKSIIELSENGRAFLLIGIFCLILFNITAMFFIWCRKKIVSINGFLIFLSMIGTYVFLIFIFQAVDDLNYGRKMHYNFLMEVELIWILAVMFLFMLMPSITILQEYNLRKNSVGYFSIKESVDYLPVGLCFSYENGVILLSNRKMNFLCYEIMGCELENAEKFWEILVSGNEFNQVKRLSYEDMPIFYFPDKRVRIFYKNRIIVEDMPIVEISAVDITDLCNLSEELKKRNDELEEMNERLRAYGKNVDEVTRKNEWLDTKIRIHSEIGQSLLATRRFLLHHSEYGQIEGLINKWYKNISVLRHSTVIEQEHTLTELYEAANSAGISIILIGNLPIGKNERNLFVSISAEALTNAVKHAGAKELYINTYEVSDTYIVKFTNNGKKPSDKIIEGGGLESLRRQIENIGGSMKTEYYPNFELIVKFPKKGSDIL